MRSMAMVLMLAACGGAETGPTPASGDIAAASAPAASEAVELVAADGVRVFGTYRAAVQPRAMVLLFHQAGSNQAEYAAIAPELAAAGYSSLAIDQRAGGARFGARNRTADAIGQASDYRSAEADLVAALAWARPRGLPVVLAGSSYSAALIFLVAAGQPDGIAGLMAFSPGEYLGEGAPVRSAATRVAAPVFVTSASQEEEIAAARTIAAAVPGGRATQHVPREGVHGASTLSVRENAGGAAENMQAVLAFLERVGDDGAAVRVTRRATGSL